MRTLRWLLLVIALLALIATGLYLRRDAALTRLANGALADYGFEVVSLSVEKLGLSSMTFSEITILETTGARYRVSDLELMLTGGGRRLKTLAASRLEIETGISTGEPAALSALLRSIAGLPAMLPGVTARLGSLSIDALPPLKAIAWRSAENSQVIELTLSDTRFTLSSAPASGSQHALQITAVTGAGESVLALDASVDTEADEPTIDGTALLQTSAWIPILSEFNLLPGELTRFDARFRGDMSIALDAPERGQAYVSSDFNLLGRARATYLASEDESLEITVDSMAPLSVESAIPSGDWQLGIAFVSGQIMAAGQEAAPFEATELECTSEIRCAMTVSVETSDRQFSGVSLGNLSLKVPLIIEATDTARILVDPAVQFSGGRLSSDAFSADRIELEGFGGMTMTQTDGVWDYTAPVLRVVVSGMRFEDAAVDAVALEFSELRLSAAGFTTLLVVPPKAVLSRGKMSAPLPGVQGSVSLRDEDLVAAFSLQDARSALSGKLRVNHRLDRSRGAASIRDLALDFKSARLSRYLDSWKSGLDLVDGALTADLTLDWRQTGDAVAIAGRLNSGLDSISGRFEKTAFVGLDTRIVASLDGGELRIEPSSLSVALIDVGVPLRDIYTDYTIDLPEQKLSVRNLSLTALGGKISADPFDYAPSAASNTIRLDARAIPLQVAVDVAQIKNLDISGSISGSIPLQISSAGVQIAGGKLASDGAGGIIRYGAGKQMLDGVVPDSQLSIVARALSNFQYDSLRSDVTYAGNGDLNLRMRLSGINPDMDATQPIIVNLNVVNNVPQTLRSLQSIRSIEDILTKRAARPAPKGK